MGRLLKPWGIKGWLAVYSFADPPQALFGYRPWLVGEDQRVFEPLQWQQQGARLVVALDGVDSRSAAESLAGLDIRVRRDQLPEPAQGQHYWQDLFGLAVIGLHDQPLGRVVNFMETGAHDVLVVEDSATRRLIPWVPEVYVQHVDMARGVIRVNWDPAWDEAS